MCCERLALCETFGGLPDFAITYRRDPGLLLSFKRTAMEEMANVRLGAERILYFYWKGEVQLTPVAGRETLPSPKPARHTGGVGS